jgi:hypothetical protein
MPIQVPPGIVPPAGPRLRELPPYASREAFAAAAQRERERLALDELRRRRADRRKSVLPPGPTPERQAVAALLRLLPRAPAAAAPTGAVSRPVPPPRPFPGG